MTDQISRDDVAETNGPALGTCTGCGSAEPPDASGRCASPNCRKFRKGNKQAFVHGGRATPTSEDERRREQLLTDVQADPLATTLREFERDYAAVSTVRDLLAKHLVAVGPMTEAGRRRAAFDAFLAASARAERLAAAIREARPDPAPKGSRIGLPAVPGLRGMPTEAVERAARLLGRLADGESLTDRELGQLDVLQAAMDGEVVLASSPVLEASDVDVSPKPAATASDEPPADEPSASVEGAESTEPIAAVPQGIQRIVDGNSPEEIERRRAEATAEMFRNVGRSSPLL